MTLIKDQSKNFLKSNSKISFQKTVERDLKRDKLEYDINIELNDRDEERLNLNIETWADVDRRTYMCWGDYWVKKKLVEAFEKLNVNVGVHPNHADVTIYLWGSVFPIRKNFPFMYNPKSYNIVWFYSHPNKMDKQEINRYDYVFCLSKNFLNVIKNWHPKVNSEPMYSCTDFKISKNKIQTDVLFVGNARGGNEFGRKAISWLNIDDLYSISIYGHKWYNHKYTEKWFKEMYWPYERLNELYGGAKITLVDGHEDMNKYGFVQMKIYDTLASGGFVLSLYNTGIKDIFGDNVPMFKNKEQMNDMIEFYLSNDSLRNNISSEARKIAIKQTYEKRAKTFLKVIKNENVVSRNIW